MNEFIEMWATSHGWWKWNDEDQNRWYKRGDSWIYSNHHVNRAFARYLRAL